MKRNRDGAGTPRELKGKEKEPGPERGRNEKETKRRPGRNAAGTKKETPETQRSVLCRNHRDDEKYVSMMRKHVELFG